MCLGHLDWHLLVAQDNQSAAAIIIWNCFTLSPAVHMPSKPILAKVMQTC